MFSVRDWLARETGLNRLQVGVAIVEGDRVRYEGGSYPIFLSVSGPRTLMGEPRPVWQLDAAWGPNESMHATVNTTDAPDWR